MSFILKTTFEKDPVQLREYLCDTLVELGSADKNIIAMDADTRGSSGFKGFMKALPAQYMDVGIAEANMVGVAAGMSAVGKIPFIHSFGPFVSRRVYDQIFLSGAYAKLNIKIVGSDPGITAAYNGGTHMPFEDMGILRCIPQITLVEPADGVQVASIVKSLAASYGVAYIRLMRKNAVGLFEPGSTFEIGKGVLLRPGKDVTIFASGILTGEALKAAAALTNEGIDARVVNLFTWKPIDREMIVKCAGETGAVVTAENHNILCGLGSAVAEVLGGCCPKPIEYVGIPDVFGEVGTEAWLQQHFNLTADAIVAAAKKAIARK